MSAVSLWAVVVELRAGKLRAGAGEIADAIAGQNFTPLDIGVAHLTAIARLPLHPRHRDPFDHLLAAQAIAEGATLMSEDRNVSLHPARCVPRSDSPPPEPASP